ncbi:hypothetical protein R1flu_014699 [Riccia fluitans]|uniref:AN1-type domain-containing protein n=1 Tax=Riccia fluitans TaxID=41844 RepID=A0ABD1YH38_9MARC
MAGGTEAFPNLGAHCAEEYCHQLDFLPFKCDSCLKVYCLEHRSYKAHDCSKVDIKDKVVLICPTCEGTVKKVYGESEETTLKQHSEDGTCSRPTRKPRCPVKGCREQLKFSNTYHCKSCGSNTCLRHRFAADHACKERNYGKLLDALAKRGAQDCGTSAGATVSNPKGIKMLADLNRHLSNISLQVV